MTGCGNAWAHPHYSELVWETGCRCTLQAGDVLLTAGEQDAWTPDLLVAAGVAADIMTAFLRLAVETGVGLLAYASQQRVDRSAGDGRPRIVITPCITVRTADDAVLARALWNRAIAASALSRVVTCPVSIDPQVIALLQPAVDCEC